MTLTLGSGSRALGKEVPGVTRIFVSQTIYSQPTPATSFPGESGASSARIHDQFPRYSKTRSGFPQGRDFTRSSAPWRGTPVPDGGHTVKSTALFRLINKHAKPFIRKPAFWQQVVLSINATYLFGGRYGRSEEPDSPPALSWWESCYPGCSWDFVKNSSCCAACREGA